MKKEKIDYILRNYSTLLNKEEREILNRLLDYLNFLDLQEVIGKEEAKEKYTLFDLDEKWIQYFQVHSRNEIRENIAQNILLRHEKEIFFNTCPVCGEIARTPIGRQCIKGHRW
jgi:hypothetical protein